MSKIKLFKRLMRYAPPNKRKLVFALPLIVGATLTPMFLVRLTADRVDSAAALLSTRGHSPEVTIQGDTSERPQLGSSFEKSKTSCDLWADDEILKTSMTVYQPIERFAGNAAEKKEARDTYPDFLLGPGGKLIPVHDLRPGSAIPDLEHSGLHPIQEQADQATIERLLKQIAWRSIRTTNMDRTEFYREMDEKLEACLESALQSTKPDGHAAVRTQLRIPSPCPDSCGQIDQKSSNNAIYQYCGCCEGTPAQADTQTSQGK